MRWWILAVVLGGCHVGTGPVVAVSSGGVRVGIDASAGPGPFVASGGFSNTIVGDGPRRTYLTFDPAYMVRVDSARNEDGRLYGLGFGGTIGAAWGEDYDGAGLAIGGFAGVVSYPTGGCYDRSVHSVMIGVRYLADVVEIFALPKVSWLFAVPCL